MAMNPAKNAVDVGMIVGDIQASLAFYEGVLGLKKVQEMPVPFGTMHRMAFGDSFVKLVAPNKVPPAGSLGLEHALGFRYLTFPVTNIAAVVEDCKKAGVKFDIEMNEFMPGVTIAMVRDPDGNVVEFVQRG